MCLRLTVIIPTYNEEKNIANALRSVAPYVSQIVIADSFSTDNTIMVASNVANNIDFISIKYTTFAGKMNEAIRASVIRNSWVMRLDADEVVIDPEDFFLKLWQSLRTDLAMVNGYYINRRYYFLGKWIKHGGMYPRHVLRIFNKNEAFYENRNVDEKVLINGKTDVLNIDIADNCHKGFLHWLKKHFQYAKREAHDALVIRHSTQQYDLEFDNLMYQNKMRYYRMPLFVRPAIYFSYRLIVQKGYRDGMIGWWYHFCHAFLYREVVDVYLFRHIIARVINGKVR